MSLLAYATRTAVRFTKSYTSRTALWLYSLLAGCHDDTLSNSWVRVNFPSTSGRETRTTVYVRSARRSLQKKNEKQSILSSTSTSHLIWKSPALFVPPMLLSSSSDWKILTCERSLAVHGRALAEHIKSVAIINKIDSLYLSSRPEKNTFSKTSLASSNLFK